MSWEAVCFFQRKWSVAKSDRLLTWAYIDSRLYFYDLLQKGDLLLILSELWWDKYIAFCFTPSSPLKKWANADTVSGCKTKWSEMAQTAFLHHVFTYQAAFPSNITDGESSKHQHPLSLCDVCGRCELTSVAAVRCSNAVVVQGLSVRGLLDGVSGGRTGHPWNGGQTMRGGFGHGRTAAIQ